MSVDWMKPQNTQWLIAKSKKEINFPMGNGKEFRFEEGKQFYIKQITKDCFRITDLILFESVIFKQYIEDNLNIISSVKDQDYIEDQFLKIKKENRVIKK